MDLMIGEWVKLDKELYGHTFAKGLQFSLYDLSSTYFEDEGLCVDSQSGHRLNHLFFFSSRRRHTRCYREWSSDVCSSDLFASVGHEADEADPDKGHGWMCRLVDAGAK